MGKCESRGARDLQVERESLFLDFSSQRFFHGLNLFFGQRRQKISFRAVMPDVTSCDREGQCYPDQRFALGWVKIISRFLCRQDMNDVPRFAAGRSANGCRIHSSVRPISADVNTHTRQNSPISLIPLPKLTPAGLQAISRNSLHLSQQPETAASMPGWGEQVAQPSHLPPQYTTSWDKVPQKRCKQRQIGPQPLIYDDFRS